MTATIPPKLGRYEVLEEIGKGAMGVVYLARDPLIGRLVALKTFRVGFSARDDELVQFRSRFVREAQSAGILSHPNIVTIHDVVDEGGSSGVCFIAMEYVKGTNLKQLLQRTEPFTPQFVVDVISQIAEALDYAHSRGVVHRDIKPANILITVDSKVKITDFGIARLDTSNLTMEGQLLGTPNYMAPEQIQGKDVDHRADIFSLGVVFYELVTRKKPFQGENLTQVTHKIVYEPFTPPEEIVKDVPAGLSSVLTRCLQKDPNRRYPRAAEVAKELRAVLEREEPVDDTVATQDVGAPGHPAPELAPTRRIDRAEMIAAAQPAAEPDLGPTRRLDRSAMLAATVTSSAAADAAAPTTVMPAAPKPVATPQPAPAPQPVSPPASHPVSHPGPPSPPPAAAPSAAAPAAAAPRPPAPPASAAPAAKPKSRHKGLWLGLAGGAALVVVGLVAVYVFSGQEAPPKPVVPVAPTTPPEQQSRITAATALAEARTRFAAGDVAGALQSVARAELAEPTNLEAKLFRETIESRNRELANEQERTLQVEEGLVVAREAYARKAWDAAITAGRAVLALDAAQEEARKLVADAQRAQRRERDALAPRPTAPVESAPVAEPGPVTPVQAAPDVAPARDAAFKIDFISEQSEGVLTIYAGERQILREGFRFVEGSNIFNRKKSSGRLEAQRRVPTGPLTIRVYVAIAGKSTKAVVVPGQIDGTKSYTLAIRVDADGRATAELR